MNFLKITNLLDSKLETKDIKTITFRFSESINPGQFFMIWIPGVDEIPMSVSYITKDIKGITFKKVGDATTALYYLLEEEPELACSHQQSNKQYKNISLQLLS